MDLIGGLVEHLTSPIGNSSADFPTIIRSSPIRLSLRLFCLLTFLCYAQAYTALSDDALRALPGPGDDFNIKTGFLLSPILIPRVSGSDGSIIVQEHLVDFFKTSLPKWTISLQNSTSKTPATGDRDVPFVNIIATRDPPWSLPGGVGHLTLVAHYDSKFTPSGFIGATDSAAPCAMLMHAARSVDVALTKKWETMQKAGIDPGEYLGMEDDMGIQIIFLDGEEAFQSWTATDSLYGARSLAAEWESTPHPALSTFKNPLSSISLFVLLDLLGAKNPRVPSYFKMTHWAYRNMATLEQRLRSLSLFESSPNYPNKDPNRHEPVFLPDFDKDTNRWMGGMVLDDHVPFMERGVDILHIIPTPFPRVWHEMDDDGDHLDLATVNDWTKLMIAFIGEWMDLEGHFVYNKKRDTIRSEL
ncbi:hypothetical protein MMC27_005312 [Xylographa pallens]|nr:hypothetical protein [Xylographa pallens]